MSIDALIEWLLGGLAVTLYSRCVFQMNRTEVHIDETTEVSLMSDPLHPFKYKEIITTICPCCGCFCSNPKDAGFVEVEL